MSMKGPKRDVNDMSAVRDTGIESNSPRRATRCRVACGVTLRIRDDSGACGMGQAAAWQWAEGLGPAADGDRKAADATSGAGRRFMLGRTLSLS